MDFHPLPHNFGRVTRTPNLRAIDERNLKQLALELYRNCVVVLKVGELSKTDYVEFSRKLGVPIQLSHDEDFPEIADITNKNVDTKKNLLGAAHWHTDQSFRSKVSSVTMLYSVHAPKSGGETKFCNMAAAYEALPSRTKDQIQDLIVIHRHGISISARPGDHTPIPPRGWDRSSTAYHPIVREHPVTGTKTLYGITGTCQGICGMELRDAQELLNELCTHAFQDQFVMQYKHEVGDIVLWDNPTTMHCASPIEAASTPENLRLLHRISLRGYPPSFDAEPQ